MDVNKLLAELNPDKDPKVTMEFIRQELQKKSKEELLVFIDTVFKIIVETSKDFELIPKGYLNNKVVYER